jgi:uncharacterized FlgJ-related protein
MTPARTKYVTKGVFLGAVTLLAMLMTIFVTLLVFSASEATAAVKASREMITKFDEAIDRTEVVAAEFKTHRAVDESEKRAMLEKLDGIKEEISLLRKDQQLLLEKLIKNDE